MDTETTVPKEEPEKPAETSAESAVDKDKEITVEIEKVEVPEKKEVEPNFQLLSNPARVLPQQVRTKLTKLNYYCNRN